MLKEKMKRWEKEYLNMNRYFKRNRGLELKLEFINRILQRNIILVNIEF